MTYHRIFNMTGATSEAGSAHPSAAHKVTPVFREVRFTQSLVFCVFFYRPLFVVLSFFFWSLYCLSFLDLRLLITPLICYFNLCLNLIFDNLLMFIYINTISYYYNFN